MRGPQNLKPIWHQLWKAYLKNATDASVCISFSEWWVIWSNCCFLWITWRTCLLISDSKLLNVSQTGLRANCLTDDIMSKNIVATKAVEWKCSKLFVCHFHYSTTFWQGWWEALVAKLHALGINSILLHFLTELHSDLFILAHLLSSLDISDLPSFLDQNNDLCWSFAGFKLVIYRCPTQQSTLAFTENEIPYMNTMF